MLIKHSGLTSLVRRSQDFTMHKGHLVITATLLCTVFLLTGCQSTASMPPSTFTSMPTLGATNAPVEKIMPTSTATLSPSETPVPSAVATETPTLSPTSPAVETLTPFPTTALPPGVTQISAKDGMVFAYVPAGEFILGSKPDDTGADEDEFPQRSIYLDAFWIDKTEVTNAMFATFLNETGGHITGRPAWLNAVKETVQIVETDGQWQPIEGLEANPVVEVTWYGAEAYCIWAGRRLPTEAEWEKAARGTDGRTYPWGEEIDCTKALFGNCPGSYTFPVGSLPDGASPYGALDMSGNVWEWVADWYALDTYTNMPAQNPHGPETGNARVVRGGSFDYNAKHNRAADRRNDGPANSSYDYGFRCAVSETP